MKRRLVSVPDSPTVRIFVRRSKSDGQESSLDTQRSGAVAFMHARGWAEHSVAEYASDGVAGDDVEGLVSLQRLLDDVRPGDIVITRSHDRLGRDMLASASTIRALIDRGASLYYYSSGEQIEWRGATDAAMSVLRGFAGQAEVENIRARTKEAIRQRVKAGKLGGGACYGYERKRVYENGREYTIAVVNEAEAKVVRRIFKMYAGGAGQGGIARTLNSEQVPSPSAGQRGSGSWAPSAIRAILLNERYIGWYVHGRMERVKKGGKRVARKADPSSIVRVEIPEWRIIDERTWQRVQKRFAEQAHLRPYKGGKPYSAGRLHHPLSGWSRCARCGGGITIRPTKISKGVRVPGYGCSFHWKQGGAKCDVRTVEPKTAVEGAVYRHLLENVLSPAVMEQITARVVQLMQEERGERAVPVEQLERDLAKLEAQQRRYAALVAEAPDVDALLEQLRSRQERITNLKAAIAAARTAPRAAQLGAAAIAREVSATFERLRHGIVGAPEEARAALRALFPGGLYFKPAGKRGGWVITGAPRIEAPVTTGSSNCDPTGT